MIVKNVKIQKPCSFNNLIIKQAWNHLWARWCEMLLVFAFTVSWLALMYQSNGARMSFLLRVQNQDVI